MPVEPNAVASLSALVRRCLADVVDEADLDDCAQEVLARLLAVADRLEPATLSSYAWVTARNLGCDHRRRTRARRGAEVLDAARREGAEVDDDPMDDASLDEREALRRAFDSLSARDRRILHARDVLGEVGPTVAEQLQVTPSTLRVALHRARARLRVRYVLDRAAVRPVGERCLPVLDAVAAGDRTAQRRTGAAAHVVGCPACSLVVDEVVAGRTGRGLAVVPLAWWALLRWLRSSRSAKVVGAAAVAGAVVAVATIAVVARRDDPADVPAAGSTATSTATSVAATASSGMLLTDGGAALVPGVAAASVVGRRVEADSVAVLQVVGDEAFWVGTSPADRVLVVLTGTPESPFTVTAGQRASFGGTVVAHGAGFGAFVGLDDAEGAVDVDGRGWHVEAAVSAVVLA